MAVNVKMGVDIGGFTSGIKQGQQILKGLNAEMKASEAEFKATGNAEKKLNDQTKTLNSQLNVQKGIADQAKKALEAMTKAGIDPADAAYQKLYVQMLNAEAGANEAQAALSKLGGGAEEAAEGADQLSNSLNGISKKLSLDQVIGGIDKITSGLENAAKKAIQLGENLFNAITEAAGWADDTATQAEMFGIDIDQFQRMQKLVTNGMDTTVESMLKSQKRLRKGIGEDSKATMETLEQLGLAISSGKDQTAHLITDDQTELFWKAGQAIMGLTDDFDKEAKAQALFGRSWEELVPLFNKYKSAEDYAKALEEVEIVSTESVENLATLNDKLSELEGNFDTLKTELLGQLAPALTDAADALNGVLKTVLEYLKTEEGQQMLEEMKNSVQELFAGMKDINAEDVVRGFKDAFDKVTGALDWIVQNKDTVIAAVEGIFGFWATLKVSKGALTILKVINGLKDLAGMGGSAAIGSGLGASLTQGVTSVAGIMGNGALMNNIPVVGDWFMNETSVGRAIGGKHADTWESVGKEFENWQREVFGDNGLIANFWNDLSHLGDENYDFENHRLKLEPEVEIPPEEKEDIQRQIDAMTPEMKVKLKLEWEFGGGKEAAESAGTGWAPHANGLAYVPYDGYLARLHKGERVMPAREVSSRNYSSNLYVESMYMNGGVDAAGLASAMAAAQRRQMSGYGS